MDSRCPPQEESDARGTPRPEGIPRSNVPHHVTGRDYIPMALFGALAGLIFYPIFLLVRFLIWIAGWISFPRSHKTHVHPPPHRTGHGRS